MEMRRNKKEVPLKRNDHCMDALRYGVMSRPAYEDEEQIEPVGNFLAAAGVAMDMDYELCFSTTGGETPYDESLGIEW
jgi:hypothetical protein